MTSTVMGWMAAGTCVTAAGLPWTAEPADCPDVLVAVMADTCRTCPVMEACAAYAAGYATAGFWAGIWHTDTLVHENGSHCEQPMLPLGEFEYAA